MPELIKWGFAVGIFALAVAFLFPSFITLPTDTAERTVELDTGEGTDLTDHLNATVTDIGNVSGTKNATVEYTNLDTLNTSSTTVNESQNSSIRLSEDDINTTIDNVTLQQGGPNTTRFTVTYPPLFGWSGGPRLFLENLELLFAIIAGLMMLGLLVVRI